MFLWVFLFSFDICACTDQLREPFLFFHHKFWHCLCWLLKYIQDFLDQWVTLGHAKRLYFAMLRPHLRHFLSCALFLASAYNDGNICNLGWKFVHSYPESSPILLQSGIFSHFLSQKSPANERPKRFRSRDTAGSSSESLCCVLLAFGVLTQMIGQSSSERWRCSGASFILTCVYALKASLACPEQLGNLEITS